MRTFVEKQEEGNQLRIRRRWEIRWIGFQIKSSDSSCDRDNLVDTAMNLVIP
jgi:hypothetical protein